VNPEVDELRPKLKEVLYDCAVEIRATKAALYLFDGPTNRFELVTEYGFRGTARQSADFNDALIDRCGRGRTPFFVNGVAAEPRLSQILFEASTDRLLVAPIYSRGQLVGVVDMRDKAAKQPFDQTDLPKAQKIAERILALFADKNVFGLRFISLANHEESADAGAPPAGTPAPAAPAPQVPPEPRAAPQLAAPVVAPAPRSAPAAETSRAHVPRLATLIIDARNAASRIVVVPPAESLGETELSLARDVLRSLLLIPGAMAVSLSSLAVLGGVQEIAARSNLTDESKAFLQSKLNVWLSKRGETSGVLRTALQTPFGTSGPPITPADLQKVFTAALSVGSIRGLYLTVAFSGTPDRASHELLAVLHAHLQLVLEQSLQRNALASLRMRVAESLVEPDFARYPELRRHTDAVVRLAEGFARFLSLPLADIENARIVALVHDVGMRLLDYERLYRKKDLSQDELGILREHVAVGAAMVEPILGGDIARAVLGHHERYDGRGYPHELHAEEIPYLSRLVQICDAYVAMTDPDTYQPPEPPERAQSIITRDAGGQFDPELVPRFLEFVRGLR
jgi:hypothetical protein